ncbi:MAG: GNAT family N-acetyltransferase [Parasphingopyxis sp.]|uniref:GNAT family N-acetyltransferase n=1 Tax=Parasphingopyxis sp. TaxID=1920299 RepID=UPI003FA13CD0
MADYTIRRAQAEDAAQLGIVGPASYAAAYGYLWPEPAPLMRHLETYGEAAVRSAMEDENTAFWVAESDGVAVGFAMAVRGSKNPSTGSESGVELRRVYVLPNVRGSGLGKRLYDAVEDYARDHGGDHIWLDVMDSADWAYGAYLSWGFLEIGSRTFEKPVYEDRRKMILLAKEIG